MPPWQAHRTTGLTWEQQGTAGIAVRVCAGIHLDVIKAEDRKRTIIYSSITTY